MESLQQQLDQLREEINLLKSSTTIPYEVGEAMKARILPDGFISSVGTTTASNTTVTDTNGAVTPVNYSVAAAMTGKITTTINGITYNIPYY